MNCQELEKGAAGTELARMRALRPLVQCITNDVVQEISANVLLAAGMSPAMVSGPEESGEFAKNAADALLCNVGTPSADKTRGMTEAAYAAGKAGKPWCLDPVGAGGSRWRDSLIQRLLDCRPTVVRGNGSEILSVAGLENSLKGVDSMDSSESALEAAHKIAARTGGVVCVTGETDYITDGERTIAVRGGNAMVTLVVGTGCALSALAAGFAAGAADPLISTAACCALVKKAAEKAALTARGPGSFHDAYLDALYSIKPSDLA